jgi:hypothetical protein
MQYDWKVGSRYKNVDAEKVGKELEALQQENGHLEAEDVVKYAEQHEGSELSKVFEWDDTRAARLYRMEQARHVIQSLVIVESGGEHKEFNVQVRAYESPGSGKGYYEIHKALSDEEIKQQVLAQVRGQIAELRRKLKAYERMIEGAQDAQLYLDKMEEYIG